MHDCPDCEQACDCDGEDVYAVAQPYWACKCDCEGFDDDEDYYSADYEDWLFVKQLTPSEPMQTTVPSHVTTLEGLAAWAMDSYIKRLEAEADQPAPPAAGTRSQSAES